MSTKFKEIEFKYNAQWMTLSDFRSACADNNPKLYTEAAGHDYFYEGKEESNFARHRVGPEFNQLTFKRKTTDKNNFVRGEINVSLAKDASKEQVEALLSEFGYRYNTTIYKNVFIYEFDNYNFVYYIVYDPDLNEIGRYFEIEMSETYPWESEAQAYEALTSLERQFKVLGISPQGRIKKSLYEMVKK